MSEQSMLDSGDGPEPFDEVFRRQEQAVDRLEQAHEAEEFQAVAMQLRESLISLIGAVRRRMDFRADESNPKAADFIGWSDVLLDKLCPGSGNKELRQFLKKSAKQTWQLVSYLTHDRDANQAACSIAAQSCDTIVGHFAQMIVRERTDNVEQCPKCSSRQIRSHFDITIEPDGDYYSSCGVCGWSSHPEAV